MKEGPSPQVKFAKTAFSVLLAILVVFVGVSICMKSYDFGYRVFTEPAMASAPGQDVLIQIKKGMSYKELGDELVEKGLIRDATLFSLQVQLSAYAKDMEPGVYTVNTSMSPKEIIVAIGEEVNAQRKAKEESTEEPTEIPNAEAQEEGTAEVPQED